MFILMLFINYILMFIHYYFGLQSSSRKYMSATWEYIAQAYYKYLWIFRK